MIVLVTGANGFLGSAVVRRLTHCDLREIRCLVRPGSDRSRLASVIAETPESNIRLVEGTLANARSIEIALAGVDTVFHIASGMTGSAADLFLSSVVASKNLLEALRCQVRTRVVLISSFGVYGRPGNSSKSILTEETSLETMPERRDLYSFAKHRQEQLFWEYRELQHFPLVVLRPGVIYGPGGSEISSRVGLSAFGLFLHLGGNNLLPLSYVDNCADAVVLAGFSDTADGHVFNVHDDDLPTCSQFLKRFRREVRRLRVLHLPFWFTRSLSGALLKYSIRSNGQLPPVLTPYKCDASWKGCRFNNSRLKALGWQQNVSTEDGLSRTFAAHREKVKQPKAEMKS